MPAPRKVLPEQTEILISFIESNQVFADGTDPRYRNINNKQWECLAEQLNCVRNGATKNVKEWRNYWADFKYKVRKRGSRLRRCTIDNSGTPSWVADRVTESDSRILAIIGMRDKPTVIQCPDYENSSASSTLQDVKESLPRESLSPKDIETPCSDSNDVERIQKLHRSNTPLAPMSQSICTDCSLYNDDKRNEIFGKLLEEEFKYIMPCARTKCYQEILKYLQKAKGQHVIEDCEDQSLADH